MHIAFVTSLVADGKPTTGFEIANEAIIAGLRAVGCKVTVIGFRQPRQNEIMDPDTIVLETLSVENSGASLLQKTRWMVEAIARSMPVGGSKLKVLSWERLKTALEKAGPLDGIIINSVQMPTAFPQLLEFAPYIYVAHNVEYRSAEQSSLSASGRKERYLYSRDARLLAPIEKQLCEGASHVFVLSEDDKATLQLSDASATMVPLVLPVDDSIGDDNLEDHQITHDVGLIGTWSWQPNFVGLKWFLDEVVPLLDSNITVSVAGNMPPLDANDYRSVNFVGRVASAEEFVEQSRILALISRSGTGVQLKTIEAFQRCMPCVATKSSIRGIPVVPGELPRRRRGTKVF